MGQGLAGVALGREAGPLLDQRHLAPQERDRARVQAVGGGGEEAQEAVLAHDQAIGPEALDADIVEIGGAVDRAARLGLGERDQGLRLPGLGTDLGRQLGEAGRAGAVVMPAQDAEARALDAPELGLAGLVRLQLVGAGADEGEVIVGEPAQELLGLGQLLGCEMGSTGCKPFPCLVDPGPHLPPVLDRQTHVAQDAEQVALELGQHGGIALPVDLDMHEALAQAVAGLARTELDQPARLVATDGEGGMDDEVDAEPVPVQLHADAVDQERHVVVDDLDDRMRRLPAMLLQARVVGAELGRPGPALLPEAEEGQGSTVEVELVPLQKVGGGYVAVEMPREAIGQRVVVIRQPARQLLADAADDLALALLGPQRHRTPSPIGPPA